MTGTFALHVASPVEVPVRGTGGGDGAGSPSPRGRRRGPRRTRPSLAGAVGPTRSRDRGRWAVVASVVLSGLGLLLVAFGCLSTMQGLALHAPASPGLAGLVAGVGVTIVVVGLLHVVAGAYAKAHRAWARYLGVAFAVLGVGLSLLALSQDVHDLRTGSMEPIGFLAIPYMVVLVGLIAGGDHFRQPMPSRTPR
jgi:hypothetical protein